ncbi:hypothetical protein ACEPPN_018000 [Leptodophora sp. 'Broadleaf-Isolate-01']
MASPVNLLLAILAFLSLGSLVAAEDSTAAGPFPKRGLAFNNPSRNYIQHWTQPGSQVNWAYNWNSVMDIDFPWGLEFVPMLWGDRPEHTTNWFNNVNNALSRGSGHILAFNEPDACGGGQACMSSQHAVDAYRKYIMLFVGRAALGAPAVTNGPGGLTWLREFLHLCTGCEIHFVPIHWYDSATNVAYFTNYVQEAHNAAGGRQIWLTEFNGSGNIDQQAQFMRTVMPWLDAQSYVFRYAWQWCDPYFTGGTIVRIDGYPSDLGGLYAYTPY